MTGPTHRVYSTLFAYIAAIIVFNLGITEMNYYVTIPIILMASKSGALFPDIDHDWSNVHNKTALNRVINFLIHYTGGKHRSWQTHSIDICAVFTILSYIIPTKLSEQGILSPVDTGAITVLLIGFSSGWISHLFSDMLTSAGVRITCLSKKKVKLVPKKIGNLRFNTGNEWEKFNYGVIKKVNIVAGLFSIVYPIVHSGLLLEYIK